MATEYDYRHQAWVVDGRYVPCGHVGECRCYGTAHAGEAAEHGPAVEWSETPRGYDARERWARRYDDLNGAPEGDWDR